MSDLNFGYDQAEQMDRQRGQMEKEREEDETKKSNFSDEQMEKLQDYYNEKVADFDEEDPDRATDAFMNWFKGENYHDLLAILNK